MYIKVKSHFESNCICCKTEIPKQAHCFVLKSKWRLRLCFICGTELNTRLSKGERLSITMLSTYKD